MRFPPLFRYGLSVALVALVADQLHKWYMLEVVGIRERMIEVTPFFNLVMVWNYGVSFGMFNDHEAEYSRYILIALTSGIVGVLLVMLRNAPNRLNAISFGLVIGGALGNIIDRMMHGAVADFFDFHISGYHWPAFNIADACIFIGVALLCYESLFSKTPDKHHETKGINHETGH